MNVNINRLQEIIENYVESFNDCAACPLYLSCPKENDNADFIFSPGIDLDCADLIIENLMEENQ